MTFSLTYLNCCGRSCKLCRSHPFDPYLVMLDERVYTANGRAKERKPVEGLFHNMEGNPHVIRGALPTGTRGIYFAAAAVTRTR